MAKYANYGSINIESTTANMDLMKVLKEQAEIDLSLKLTINKLDLTVSEDCIILINEKPVLVKSDGGFTIGEDDVAISSLVCKTEGIEIYAVVGY